MLRKILVLASLMTISVINTSFAEMSADDIMKKSDALAQPKTVRSLAKMTITKDGEELKREISLEGIKSGKNDKILVVIKEVPGGDITKVLTFTERGGDDQQWLKMKNGKIKKISSEDRSGAFANSHIFYEDLKSRMVEDFTYEMSGESKEGEYNCWKISAVPKPGKSIYDKAEFYIIKDGEFQYFIIRADIYYQGTFFKKVINYSLKTIDGVITPKKNIVTRIDKDGKEMGNTVVEIEKLQYNSKEITEDRFNQSKM